MDIYNGMTIILWISVIIIFSMSDIIKSTDMHYVISENSFPKQNCKKWYPGIEDTGHFLEKSLEFQINTEFFL